MADIMSWLDRRYLYAQDLDKAKDHTFEIERLEPGKIPGSGGVQSLALVYFKGVPKPLGIKSTNILAIEKIHGTRDHLKLVGKRVTLYVTTTKTAEGMRECIRIRPVLPPDEPAKTPPKKEQANQPRDPNSTKPPTEDEAKLRAAYGAELKALAATLQLDGKAIKERYGDLTQLTTERLGEICTDLNRESMVGK